MALSLRPKLARGNARLRSDEELSVAGITTRLNRERAAAATAAAEIGALEKERAGAPSYEAAAELDEKLARARWQIDHSKRLIPEIERELAAATVATKKAGVAKFQRQSREAYQKLRAAIIVAVDAQIEAMRLHDAAVAELGEAMAQMYLPAVAFRGFLLPDLVELWTHEQDRVFGSQMPEPLPTPEPDPNAPASVYRSPTTRVAQTGASGRPAQPPQIVPGPAPRRVARELRADPIATDPMMRTVTIIGRHVDLDGFQCLPGDRLTISTAAATQLVANGAADFYTEEAANA